MASGSGLVRVFADRHLRGEMPVAFEAKAERTSDRHQFRQADIAKLRALHPEIAEAEQEVGVFCVALGDQLSARGPRREQLQRRPAVDAKFKGHALSVVVDCVVGPQLAVDRLCDDHHLGVLSLCVWRSL